VGAVGRQARRAAESVALCYGEAAQRGMAADPRRELSSELRGQYT